MNRPEDGPSVVVVGIDGSPTSSRALAYAAGIVHRQGARLVALYVVESGWLGGLAGASGIAAGQLQQGQDRLAKELRASVEQINHRAGIEGEFHVRHGERAIELERIADDVLADLLVLGASTHAGHQFIGSLAVHFVRNCDRPIMIVP